MKPILMLRLDDSNYVPESHIGQEIKAQLLWLTRRQALPAPGLETPNPQPQTAGSSTYPHSRV